MFPGVCCNSHLLPPIEGHASSMFLQMMIISGCSSPNSRWR